MIDPFHMDRPGYRNLAKLYVYRTMYNFPPYYFTSKATIRDGSVWTAVAPAIIAANKEYNTRLGELGPQYDPEGYKTGYEKLPVSAQKYVDPSGRVTAGAGGGNIFANLFKALFGDVKASAGANYNHPLLKQGLVRGKK